MRMKKIPPIRTLLTFLCLSYFGFVALGFLVHGMSDSPSTDWFGCKRVILTGLIVGMPIGCIAGVACIELQRGGFFVRRFLVRASAAITLNAVSVGLGLFLADRYAGVLLLATPMLAGALCTLLCIPRPGRSVPEMTATRGKEEDKSLRQVFDGILAGGAMTVPADEFKKLAFTPMALR